MSSTDTTATTTMLHVRVPDSTIARLKAIAKRDERNVSQLVRIAITRLLEDEE